MQTSLTLAEVAGIINVGVVLLQFTFPLLLVFLLIGILPIESNAATWSVAGRTLNGSWWPSILRTDTAATSKVSNRVIFISIGSTFGLLLLAAAAVVTPLGLYDTITADSTESSAFVYARDLSPIGQATPARDDYNTSRLCGFWTWLNCPGQEHGFYYTSNSSGEYVNWDNNTAYISSVIPNNLTEVFSSGREGDLATVATPFDIQYRSYKLKRTPESDTSVLLNSLRPHYNVDQQRLRTTGAFEAYDSFILASDFVIREGVVADMKKGGIGFRNHTIPANVRQGAEWTESLLWLEPETVCVNNNITIHFQLPVDNVLSQRNYLVDRGGVTTKEKNYPYIDLNDTQNRPEMYARAHKGAVLLNFNLRVLLNISNNNASYYGKKFIVSSSTYKPGVAHGGTFDSGIPGTTMSLSPSSNLSLIDSIGLVTEGYGGADKANVSRVAVTGGVILGAPVSTDKGLTNSRNDPGTNFSAPVFSCVTAIRAFVMNVTFYINDTASLENLRVRSATPRTYASNASTPLWAIENTSNYNVSDIQPLWGIVADNYEHNPALWTLRRDCIYLPAGSDAMNFGSLNGMSDSSAAGGGLAILQNLYSGAFTSLSELPDYTGSKSLSLRSKWQGLTQKADGIPNMLSLVWTDVAVNYLMGARGQLNTNFSSVSTTAQRQAQKNPTSISIPVQTYERSIRYNLKYAIVAIVFLSIYVMVLAAALGMWILQKSTFTALKTLLNQTSVGRVVTVERYASQGLRGSQARTMSTKNWINEFGGEDIGISKDVPKTEGREYSQVDSEEAVVEQVSSKIEGKQA